MRSSRFEVFFLEIGEGSDFASSRSRLSQKVIGRRPQKRGGNVWARSDKLGRLELLSASSRGIMGRLGHHKLSSQIRPSPGVMRIGLDKGEVVESGYDMEF